MNSLLLKVASLLPYYKLALWLIAEAGYKQKVAEWLAAENAWYFKLAAVAWGALYEEHPDQLKVLLAAKNDEATP